MATAVIFDCDGVLVDSEVICLAEELRFLAEIGLVYRRDDYCRRFMGLSGPAFKAALNQDRLERLGDGLPADFMARLMAAVEAEWRRSLRPVAGAEALAAALSGKKAVASSTSLDYLHWKLGHTGLYDHFAPHLYSAESVTRSKPAPDLFLHSAAALEAAPAACVVIEDSAHGIRAAKAAGMTAVGFLGGGHSWPGHEALLHEAGADHIASDYDGVTGLLHRDFGL
jgi:HAD superfamily hydrolase (TIGR01509 family)